MSFDRDLVFVISVIPLGYNGLSNLIDIDNALYINLIGSSMVYRLYKYILNVVDFITTDRNNTIDAKNLWFNLLQDVDVYSGVNDMYCVIIKKNINSDRLMSIYKSLSDFKFIYDDELLIKLGDGDNN